MKSPQMRVPTGNLLAAARRAAGLQQAELASLAGVDSSTISRIESCGKQPVKATSRNLDAVLDALRANGVEVLEDGLRLVPKKRGR